MSNVFVSPAELATRHAPPLPLTASPTSTFSPISFGTPTPGTPALSFRTETRRSSTGPTTPVTSQEWLDVTIVGCGSPTTSDESLSDEVVKAPVVLRYPSEDPSYVDQPGQPFGGQPENLFFALTRELCPTELGQESTKFPVEPRARLVALERPEVPTPSVWVAGGSRVRRTKSEDGKRLGALAMKREDLRIWAGRKAEAWADKLGDWKWEIVELGYKLRK